MELISGKFQRVKQKEVTSEFALELCKIEENDKVMVNFYAMFQIRKAVGQSQMFFKLGVLKNFANFIGKHLCWSLF